MFVLEALRGAKELLSQALAELDPETLSAPDARELLAAGSEVAGLGQAAVTLAAGAVERTVAWSGSGSRSARSYVSAVCGISSGSAERMLDLSARLKRFPATARAFSSGLISAAEAEEVSRAAARNADAEADLLDTARTGSFSKLRDRANATQSPSPEDDARRAEAARKNRDVRTWVDSDGVGHLHARGPVGDIGLLDAWIKARSDVIFDEARSAGTRESPGAYRFDALMELLRDPVAPVVPEGGYGGSSQPVGTDAAPPGGSGPPPPGPLARRVDMLIRVDFAALRRGSAGPDELCEVAGVGPIPVADATAYLGQAALKFILTEGVDIRAVAHCGRNIGSHLRSALLWRFRTCSEPGCDRALGLENDHQVPYAKGGMTEFDNIRPKCHQCHQEKTKRDYPNGTAEYRGRNRSPVPAP